MIIKNLHHDEFYTGVKVQEGTNCIGYSPEYPDAEIFTNTMKANAKAKKLKEQTGQSHAVISQYGFENEKVIFTAKVF